MKLKNKKFFETKVSVMDETNVVCCTCYAIKKVALKKCAFLLQYIPLMRLGRKQVTGWFLEYQKMDKGQKLSDHVCYAYYQNLYESTSFMKVHFNIMLSSTSVSRMASFHCIFPCFSSPCAFYIFHPLLNLISAP